MPKPPVGASPTLEAPRIPDGLEPAVVADEAELEGALIADADFTERYIEELSLEATRLEKCRLTGADFRRLSLRDCEFLDCEMSGSFLKNLEAERVQFTRCRMAGAVLTSAAMHPGALSLKGATITSDLVLPLVPMVFAAAGIRIDDGEPEVD